MPKPRPFSSPKPEQALRASGYTRYVSGPWCAQIRGALYPVAGRAELCLPACLPLSLLLSLAFRMLNRLTQQALMHSIYNTLLGYHTAPYSAC